MNRSRLQSGRRARFNGKRARLRRWRTHRALRTGGR